jgi:ribonuclease P protein component
VTRYGRVVAVRHFRVGLLAPKRTLDKRAVVRNRAKRRLREAARAVLPTAARDGAGPPPVTHPLHSQRG